MGEESSVRWSSFKILMTLVLLGISGYAIYSATEPILDQDYSLKSFVNLVFILLIVVFILGIFKVRRNYQYVFWACGLGLLLFVTVMFVNYDSLLG